MANGSRMGAGGSKPFAKVLSSRKEKPAGKPSGNYDNADLDTRGKSWDSPKTEKGAKALAKFSKFVKVGNQIYSAVHGTGGGSLPDTHPHGSNEQKKENEKAGEEKHKVIQPKEAAAEATSGDTLTKRVKRIKKSVDAAGIAGSTLKQLD